MQFPDRAPHPCSDFLKACHAGPFCSTHRNTIEIKCPLVRKMLHVDVRALAPFIPPAGGIMKNTRSFVFFVMFVFSLSLTVQAFAAGSNQAGQPQPQAQSGKQSPQAVKPIPAVKMTPPAAPKTPNVRPGQPQQSQAQQNQQLKMWEERKQQEKAREKMLKDAKTVQVAPAKEKSATPGQNAQSNSLNRTATDLGSPKR